ncbi:hypothetical protein CVUC_05270 [Caulobacter vibrioides]|nr:hypothetical protein CA608_11965 [Caulobacter vibrioides]PLR13962.1 hypothetical protein CVUC_05270 [Caulobacter vibrioides]
MFENDVTLRQAGDALGCSHEHVRRICLHPDDAGRSYPDDDLIARIEAFTQGAVTRKDFPLPEALQAGAVQ